MQPQQPAEFAADPLAAMRALGLTSEHIDALALEVESQLAKITQDDIAELLSDLDADTFVRYIDIHKLANRIHVDPQVAQAAVKLLAPLIAEFSASARPLSRHDHDEITPVHN